MFRIAFALFALVLAASVADAQARTLPLSPGVAPGSPWGPGMPMAPSRPAPPGSMGRSNGFAPVVPGFGYGYGYGYGLGYPFYSPYGYYDYGLGYPPPGAEYGPLSGINPLQPVATATYAPASAAPISVASKESSATLVIQLPAAGEVWLDGKRASSEAAEEQTLISPLLQAGEGYKFNVKAKWTYKGKTYEATRAVTVNAGDRSRLMIVSGDEVSK